MAEFYSARGWEIPPLPWTNLSPPFSQRLAGDIVRQANTSDVTALRRDARDLKDVVAEQTLELRLLKKNRLGDGDDLQ